MVWAAINNPFPDNTENQAPQPATPTEKAGVEIPIFRSLPEQPVKKIQLGGTPHPTGTRSVSDKPEEKKRNDPTLQDAADPTQLDIPVRGIAAPIDPTGPSYESTRFNPAMGRIDFWLEPSTAKPCEAGPAYMLAHVTRTFRNLVDDPAVPDDHGVPAESKITVTLTDGTRCVFEVVDFDLNIGEPVPGTPAHRVNKSEWAATLWRKSIEMTQSRPVLFLLTSGGLEFEVVNGENHRIHADVVMAELVEVHPPG